MKKIIKLLTTIAAVNLVVVNGALLIFIPNNMQYSSNMQYYSKHDANASLLKWKSLTPNEIKFVTKYESQIHKTASSESKNEFNKLYDNSNDPAIWKKYQSLQNDLTHTKIGDKTIDVNWDNMYKKANLNDQQLQLAESQQLRFYNIFAQVFQKKNVIKLIQKVEPVAVTDNTVAWTAFNPNTDSQRMGYGPQFVNQQLIDEQYQAGFWSSDQIISVTTHEYGHALSNFFGLSINERKLFNTNWRWSNNDNSASKNANTFIDKVTKNSKQINDRAWDLIDYLAKKAKITNTKEKLLFALITVDSNYGRAAWNGYYHPDLDDEFFAESFARWILTPENERDWGWELENDFFLHHLPKFL